MAKTTNRAGGHHIPAMPEPARTPARPASGSDPAHGPAHPVSRKPNGGAPAGHGNGNGNGNN